jgi:hypothetical protein
MSKPLFAALLFGAVLAAGAVRAQTETYQASLNGASETPPNPSLGTGTATAVLDVPSKTFRWTVRYSGLSGAATMAHFHGPAAPGVAAGVQIPLTGDLTSPTNGQATLTDSQIADLQAGLWYVNVHTAQYPKGEIRGQVIPVR